MKNLFVSLSVSMILFIAGCQESPIDSVSNELFDKTEIQKTGINLHGTIPLQGLLDDPRPVGNSYYQISGQIKYIYRISERDPISPAPQMNLAIHFETNADFQYFCTVCNPPESEVLTGFITDQSDDNIRLIGNTVTEFEKTFPIQSIESEMDLKVRFRISYNRIEISAMWLALRDKQNAAATN